MRCTQCDTCVPKLRGKYTFASWMYQASEMFNINYCWTWWSKCERAFNSLLQIHQQHTTTTYMSRAFWTFEQNSQSYINKQHTAYISIERTATCDDCIFPTKRPPFHLSEFHAAGSFYRNMEMEHLAYCCYTQIIARNMFMPMLLLACSVPYY